MLSRAQHVRSCVQASLVLYARFPRGFLKASTTCPFLSGKK